VTTVQEYSKIIIGAWDEFRGVPSKTKGNSSTADYNVVFIDLVVLLEQVNKKQQTK
jgi:hypothetical protein